VVGVEADAAELQKAVSNEGGCTVNVGTTSAVTRQSARMPLHTLVTAFRAAPTKLVFLIAGVPTNETASPPYHAKAARLS
jgi:hypothetical protein